MPSTAVCDNVWLQLVTTVTSRSLAVVWPAYPEQALIGWEVCMVRVFRSTVIPASVERVWHIVRDFNALPLWFQGAVSSEIEDGKDPATVGCIRRVLADDSNTVREMLTELSDADFRCSYTLLSSPYPMRDYAATFKLHPVTDADHCYMTWSSTFNVDADKEQATVRFVNDKIYGRAYARLTQLVAG